MKIQKLIFSIMAASSVSFLSSVSAQATTWYVRDGGGTPAQCTGQSNAVYPGSGAGQACAYNNPMYVLGAGCGNGGGGPCDVAGVMKTGDTLDIVGDSDINSGQQAQYPIGYDASGVVTPTNGNNCNASGSLNCTMGNMPANSSVVGIGNHRPQLWGREHLNQVLNANGGGAVTINNLEITQHSSCVYNGVDPKGTTGGFPDVCDRTTAPYGPWAIAGISLTGTGIILENSWIHGMAQWGITTGNLTNFTEQNNVISGNGGGGVGLGQNISNSGTMTLGGTTTVSNETIVFNGCGELYPMHSSSPFDTSNYYNCADDDSSNGQILADGWGMEAGTGVCNLVNMSNTNISFNTKGGIDNLHCNGTGTFNLYRSRMEGNESQQLKLNYGAVNIENSQIINDCNFFEGQPFTTTVDANGNTPPSLGYDFCRASGNGLRLVSNSSGTYNLSNSTFFSDGGANIELPAVTCNAATKVNINNNLVIGAPDYTRGDTQPTDFWENDTGTCSPIVENNNLVYDVHDPQDCAGSDDICTNPSNAGVNGNFALNASYAFSGIDLADQFYPSSSSPLIGEANSNLALTGTSNDYNNYPRGSSWDIGSLQHGSSVASGGTCFITSECASGICSNFVCAAPVKPTVTITSPSNGSTFTAGNNLTVTTTASETNGTIKNISLYNGAGASLGSSSASPYNYVTSAVVPGTYNFTAQATDANGITSSSNPVSITISPATVLPSLPVVTITSPANGSTFAQGSNISITATASETNGTIKNISLYTGTGILLGSGSSSPYTYVASDVLAGTYTLTAVATDANGVSTTSSPVSVIVGTPVTSPPVVAMTAPANGSSFTPGSSISLKASASETNGSIAKVNFYYNGTNLLGTSTSAPYSMTVGDVPAGTYTLTAAATDANGVSVTSGPVSITVAASTAPLSPAVSISSPGSGSVIAAGSNLTITAAASESGGSISKVNFYYAGTNLLGTATSSPYSTTVDDVPAGSYTLTATAYDASGHTTTSAPVIVTAKNEPVVSITSPTNGSSYNGGANVTIKAAASENGGSISRVSFYYDGTNLLGTSSSSPYSYTVGGVPAGTYTLTVSATDANGVSVTSSPVTITVK